jgi:uncharacterized protein involved in exopolysaccharide biosynthesis
VVTAIAELTRPGKELSLRELIVRLWRGRWLISASAFAFAVIFGTAAFLMTPMYRASTVLVVVDPERTAALSGDVGGLSNITSIFGGGPKASPVEEALAVLRSREFTEAFIKDQRLMPELYPDLWDSKANAWKVPADRQPTLAQAARYFSELRTARQDLNTGLVEIQIEWRDPKRAADWVNGLVARLNDVMRARAVARADAYLGYLRQELTRTEETEAREALGRLMEAQINQRMFANVTREYALRVVDAALVPDVKARPKRALMIMLGGITGVLTACVAVLAITPARSRSPQ